MQVNQPVSTIVNGQAVNGVIRTRSHRSLCVEITRPYSGLNNYSNIPLFAAGKCDFRTSYGDDKALGLLLELYAVGERLSLELPALRAKWGRTQELIDAILAGDDSIENVRAEKRRLRGELKSKLIHPHEYQRALTDLQERDSNRKDEVFKLAESFFNEYVPYVTSYRLQDQVVELLQGDRETLLTPSPQIEDESLSQ